MKRTRQLDRISPVGVSEERLTLDLVAGKGRNPPIMNLKQQA
jgi:hypothetical protein